MDGSGNRIAPKTPAFKSWAPRPQRYPCWLRSPVR